MPKASSKLKKLLETQNKQARILGVSLKNGPKEYYGFLMSLDNYYNYTRRLLADQLNDVLSNRTVMLRRIPNELKTRL
jgi:hypothetical protein